MKKCIFFMSILAMALLTACGEPAQPEQVTVNPNPLIVVGNKITAQITGTFPVKKFKKNAVLVVTPVLKYNGQEVIGESVTYVGQKVKENGIEVNYKAGGVYSQVASFDYVPEMAQCELYLRFEARNGNKIEEVPDMKIADGAITTSTMVDAKSVPAKVVTDRFQRVIQEIQEADIKFLMQQSNVRSSETQSASVKALQAAMKDAAKADRKEVNKVEVSGYASPDGALELNTRLANERQKNAQKYMAQQMKKNKVNANIVSDITAEDWEGFQKAMEASNIEDKNLVLNVLRMYNDPEEREAQIKNLSAVYKNIADEILPALRRSRMILTIDLIGKTDEEILALFNEDASKLNVEELLYTATLVQDKKAVYTKVMEIYPNEYRGWNNMGLLYFQEGNVTEARRYYNQALQLNASDPDVNYNAALAAMAENDMSAAEIYLGKAAGTSGDLAAAQGTFYTMKGEFQKAKAAYGNDISNNAAIQQILNEDYAGARKTLNTIAAPDAKTAYLLAIVGARTNDREAVYSNLKVAVSKCSKMKEKALKDIEFAKFAADETFLSIVK